MFCRLPHRSLIHNIKGASKLGLVYKDAWLEYCWFLYSITVFASQPSYSPSYLEHPDPATEHFSHLATPTTSGLQIEWMGISQLVDHVPDHV